MADLTAVDVRMERARGQLRRLQGAMRFFRCQCSRTLMI